MEPLVIAVLAGAALQSILKLALLPLRRRLPLCVAAVLPALIWHDRLAAFNYQRMLQQLGSSELLATLCLCVVLQELLTLVIGWKLLDEEEEKRCRWRFIALLPSLLLIPGTFYLEIFCFNRLVGWNFEVTAALLAIAGAGTLLGGSALARKLFPRRDDRIGALLGAEYLLLLGTIFLPVALECRIGEDPGPGIGMIHLAVFGGLFAGALLFFLLFHGIEIIKERKHHALHHTNS